MNEEEMDYRKALADLEAQAQSHYDKLVVYLAGGAMALSFAFLQDIVGDGPAYSPAALVWAWGMWLLSLLFALGSHYASTLAMRKAVQEFDSGVRNYTLGGSYTTLVKALNPAAGFAFLVGAFSAGVFLYRNLVG